MKNIKKAIIYTRVSTDDQADKGYSLMDQDERLRRYCKENDIEVLAHFKEDHSAKTFDRPEFTKLVDYVLSNKLRNIYLLFIKWDRFSRNSADAYIMLRKLNELGIEPKAIDQPLDMNVPENKIMLAIYIATPEVENDRRSLNTRMGMRRARKEGRWLRKAPLGYVNARDENNKPIIIGI